MKIWMTRLLACVALSAVSGSPALAQFNSPEVAKACNTDDMRLRAFDNDTVNDFVRVGSSIVNCIDYFAYMLESNEPMNVTALSGAVQEAGTETQTYRFVMRSPDRSVQAARPANHGIASIVVEEGQTLYYLARKHCTTVKHLMALNDLTDAYIQIGQSLRIPGQSCR